ncbi:MAG TPA: PAS domain-containing protein [Bryobacteraceae bacterium]|nr:PAS domain-containing protein [Bryobacteraceae bacterium]
MCPSPFSEAALLSTVHDAVIATDAQGIIQVWNSGAQRVYGYPESEAIGQSVAMLYFPEDLELLPAAVFGPLETAALHEVTLRHRRKDGAAIFIELRVAAIRREGVLVGYVGCSNDITARNTAAEALARAHADLEGRVAERTCERARANTRLQAEIDERHRAEAELRASRERLRHLLRSVPGVVYSCLPSGEFNVTFMGDNVAAVFGYPPERFTADPRFWADHVHPEDRARVLAEAGRITRTGRLTGDYRFLHADDAYRWVHDSAALIRDESGAPAEIIGYWADVTEVRQAEEARREQERLHLLAHALLVAQESERKRISRELHDDLNQRLAVLILDIGRMEHSLPPEVSSLREELRVLRKSVGDASDALRDLALRLHPARLEQFGLQAALESECQAFSARTGIRVSFECRASRLWLPDEVALCLYRVAQEALRNAARHSRAPSVSVSLGSRENGVCLSIQDSGVGFDPRASGRGPGLGIISMAERVQLAGGIFSVDSAIGRGALIEVWIPLSEVAHEKAARVARG